MREKYKKSIQRELIRLTSKKDKKEANRTDRRERRWQKKKNETKRNEKGKGKGTDTKKIRNSVKKEEVV